MTTIPSLPQQAENDFMDGLCTGFYTDADGFWDYGIDLSMKSFMQAKLLRAMLRFQP